MGAVNHEPWWRKNARIEYVNPRHVRTAGIHSEKHVQKYMKHPNAGDTPCLIKYSSTHYWCCDGAHHREAARRTGRRMRAMVVPVEVHRAASAGSAGCLLSIMTLGLAPLLMRRR